MIEEEEEDDYGTFDAASDLVEVDQFSGGRQRTSQIKAQRRNPTRARCAVRTLAGQGSRSVGDYSELNTLWTIVCTEALSRSDDSTGVERNACYRVKRYDS